MFTPRGVTKRFRAAVTGYYVLPPLLLLLLLTGRRRYAAVLLLKFVCLRSGITSDSVTQIISDTPRYHFIYHPVPQIGVRRFLSDLDAPSAADSENARAQPTRPNGLVPVICSSGQQEDQSIAAAGTPIGRARRAAVYAVRVFRLFVVRLISHCKQSLRVVHPWKCSPWTPKFPKTEFFVV